MNNTKLSPVYYTPDPMNEWIQFVVFVPEEHGQAVADLIGSTMMEFWEQDDMCYGDMIEKALDNSGVQYTITYAPDCIDTDEALSDEWYSFVNSLEGCIVA